MWSFAIDVVFVTLLVATIVFVIRLERRLASLRGTKDQLAAVIAELNVAATRAEAGIKGLRTAAETAGASLEDRVRRGRSLYDELGTLVQSGQRVAQKLEMVRPAVRSASTFTDEPRRESLRSGKVR
jgi:hypothetical protein